MRNKNKKTIVDNINCFLNLKNIKTSVGINEKNVNSNQGVAKMSDAKIEAKIASIITKIIDFFIRDFVNKYTPIGRMEIR